MEGPAAPEGHGPSHGQEWPCSEEKRSLQCIKEYEWSLHVKVNSGVQEQLGQPNLMFEGDES